MLIVTQFARKEFEFHGSGDHEKERRNLAILNHLAHPNILQLLGSYTSNGRHSLLFPLAESGNLAELLATERQLTSFTSDESLMIALASLSSAVEHVHYFTERKIDLELIGCHNDLRPRNILVSNSTFVLSDFGLSTFKDISENSATRFKDGNNDDYLAPECEDWDNNFQAGTVHRSSDIWSFGCIAADIATYMARGHEGVASFRTQREHKVRRFYLYYFHQGPQKRSEAVEQWLAELELTSTRSCALLVRLVRQILRLDPLERPNAKEVTSRLRLVVLYEVSLSIDDIFRQLRNEEDSLDIFLEAIGFESWRYAMGILEPKNEPIQPRGTTFDVILQFDKILECLNRVRESLISRLSGGIYAPSNMSQITGLNDELHSFLGKEQKMISREYFNITIMEGVDELVEQSEDENTILALSHEIRMRAKVKHINAFLAKDHGSKSRALQVSRDLFEQGARVGDHHLGSIHDIQPPRTVWVEWRSYGQHGTDHHTLNKLFDRASGIVELLSQEKPEEFRTLKSKGFFHEPNRAAFGIIFELPFSVESPESLKPISLDRVIQETTKNIRQWPDLNDRFKLASCLAASILELHTVGWFHRALTSSNIVFFPRVDDAEARSVRELFLVGFNHSRPDDPLAFTSGLTNSSFRDYQHPSYLKDGSGYRPGFDYYSLGIILMEIGFWRPFNEIIGQSYKGLSYEARRQRLSQDRIPILKQQMGREYFEAVTWCIQGDPVELALGSFGRKDMLLAFRENVVARLRGCFD